MNEDKLHNIRHTLAHLLASAVLEWDPAVKLAIGPVIETGFYYDMLFSKPLSEGDLKSLQKHMEHLVKQRLPMTGKEVSYAEARDFFKDQPFKLELIADLEKEGQKLTLYTVGTFTDLCRGGHAENTSEIPEHSFKLDKLAGAYWRGKEDNAQLTRVYGLSFESKEKLESHLTMIEEAKKRDHRKLGKELDLFVFSELVGSGLPLYTPKGTILRKELLAFSEGLQVAAGYQETWCPHITKIDLYKKSGHWDKFGAELFLVKSQETSDEFAMKPMNCPHHTQIYASRARSYRDLPIRLMESTTMYRDEKTGEMAGLTRVRSLTQDDAHLFCRLDQVEAEFETIMNMIKTVYSTLGMKFRARLSYRDPAKPEKFLGDVEKWNQAQEILEKISKKLGLDYTIGIGEAAFYGPKIDIMETDAIGREWQCATEQLDFVQPARFELEYTDKDGSKQTPVMIHKALLGTIDRFLGVYIEHTAGNFPTWLSPVQVAILPISDKHIEYSRTVADELKKSGVRVELHEENDTLGKKIRNAKGTKVPYMLVIGDAEVNDKTVTVEHREKGKIGAQSVAEFVAQITEEIKKRL